MKIAYSQPDTNYLKNQVCTQYGLPIETKIEFLHSRFNDTYKIKTLEKTYILRLYRVDWKPLKDIEAEVAFTEQLNRRSVTVSFPIKDINGQYINSIESPEGTRYYVLFSYAEGNPLEQLDQSTAVLFGSELARIHQVSWSLRSTSFSKNYAPGDIFDNALKALDRRSNPNSPIVESLKEIERFFMKKISRYDWQSTPQGICHGDPHFENCYYHSGDYKMTFFDFDFCGTGYFLYDIGSFFRYERDNKEIKKAFLMGYSDVTALSQIEINLIPYFEVLMRVFHLGARAAHEDGTKNPIWPADQIEKNLKDISVQVEQLS